MPRSALVRWGIVRKGNALSYAFLLAALAMLVALHLKYAGPLLGSLGFPGWAQPFLDIVLPV